MTTEPVTLHDVLSFVRWTMALLVPALITIATSLLWLAYRSGGLVRGIDHIADSLRTHDTRLTALERSSGKIRERLAAHEARDGIPNAVDVDNSGPNNPR